MVERREPQCFLLEFHTLVSQISQKVLTNFMGGKIEKGDCAFIKYARTRRKAEDNDTGSGKSMGKREEELEAVLRSGAGSGSFVEQVACDTGAGGRNKQNYIYIFGV